MLSFPKKSNKRRNNRRRLKCESLEGRRLLAVVWSNRGTETNDTDGFNTRFGEEAEIARETVDSAISNWNDVITSFNYAASSLNDTYDITIMVGATNAGVAASTDIDHFEATGKPTRGTIILGNTTNWELDSTPEDNIGFTDLTTPFWAVDPTKSGVSGKDLLQSMQHELGHAIGINRGVGSAARPLTVDTGLIDPNDRDQTDKLFLLRADSGLEVTMVKGHFYEGPDLEYMGSNLPVVTNDLMNSGRTAPDTSVRRLISDFDATFLQDVYGYTVRMPSTINTFHAELDQAASQLVVNGLETSDLVSVQQREGITRVDVRYTTERFASDSIETTKISTFDGNDLIRLDSTLSGTMTIDGGEGNDILEFSEAVDAVFASSDNQGGGILKTENGLTIKYSGIERFDFVRPDAGGPYSVDEGSGVLLHGTFTPPPTPDEKESTWEDKAWSRVLNEPVFEAASVGEVASANVVANSLDNGTQEQIEWDLDGDGIFGETDGAGLYGDEIGAEVSFDATLIDGTADGTVIPVSFRVTDSNGNIITSRSQVVVKNVAPKLNALAVSSTLITEGESLALTGVFTDPSEGDAHRVLITWGDGTTEKINLNSGERSFRVEHTYAEPGTPTLSVRILDDDGGSTPAKSIDVEVNAKPIANPDRVETGEDVVVNIDVLANDGDRDGDSLSVVDAMSINGTVRIEDNGTLTYRPALNFRGVDTIVYRVSDGRGGISESTVTVRVLSPGQQLLKIREDVKSLRESGELTKGQAGSLIKKLEPKGSLKATINSLRSFIQQVGDLVEQGELEREDGLRLIGAVRDIRTGLFLR